MDSTASAVEDGGVPISAEGFVTTARKVKNVLPLRGSDSQKLDGLIKSFIDEEFGILADLIYTCAL